MSGAKNKRGITHLKRKRVESENMWPGEGFNWSNLYSKSRKARFYCVQTRLFSTEVVDLKETKKNECVYTSGYSSYILCTFCSDFISFASQVAL